MDNVVIIKIEGVEYEFKLKSSSILYLEKKLGRNIFEAFQNPDFTTMVNLFYACASNECKIKYGSNEANLFDALLADYDMQELAEKYLADIIQKSGLVQKQNTPTPSPEIKEKTWNK